MGARQEFRDRDEVEVAVLDALVDRPEEGMTVFELRSRVDVGIDDLEDALAALKMDGLIEADPGGGRTTIEPDERVLPDPDADDHEATMLDRIIERLPL